MFHIEGTVMSRSDPTDDVLAAIASIFDKSDATLAAQHPDEMMPESQSSAVATTRTVDGYSRSGPGPLDAIRFRWTARRDDNGEFFVDETIGAQSRTMSSGPIPESEVIAFIDSRVHEARERFDKLKDEMTMRPADPSAARIAVERAHVEHDASEDQGF
jgi:hypothetical protein